MDKITSAVVGGLLGTVLTLLTVGWSEAEKLTQFYRAKALAEFVEAAWGEGEDDRLLYDRKVSSLTVYASPEIIRNHASWVQLHCNDTTRSKTKICQDAWANVIGEMRKYTGLQPVEKQYIIDAIWEKPEG